MRKRAYYRRRRWPKRLALLLALIVAAPLALYLHLRASLPQISGILQVNGLSAAIDIARDARADRPHIRLTRFTADHAENHCGTATSIGQRRNTFAPETRCVSIHLTFGSAGR